MFTQVWAPDFLDAKMPLTVKHTTDSEIAFLEKKKEKEAPPD